jgi:hypothetical protein
LELKKKGLRNMSGKHSSSSAPKKTPTKNTFWTATFAVFAATSIGLAASNPIYIPLASTVIPAAVTAMVQLNNKSKSSDSQIEEDKEI